MKRQARSRRWIVAWRRDDFADGDVPGYGERLIRLEEDAREVAQQFDRPQAWAAVIDPYSYQIVAEFGYRFAVGTRKPPARATAPRLGVATGELEATESMRTVAGARPRSVPAHA